MNPNEGPKVCKCPHHKVMPVAVVLIAVTVLLANFNVFSWYVADIIWPILLIVAVWPKLCRCKCCEEKK
ncbi:MAG: hypothetical protein ABSF56_00655 [Minisyncoccia bacterium]